METLLKLSSKRFAAREYNTKTVKKEDLDYIFEVTNNAPTAFGLENWRILNLQSFEARKSVSDAFCETNFLNLMQASNLILFITKDATAFIKDDKWLTERLKHILKRYDDTYNTQFQNDPKKLAYMSKRLLNEDHGNNKKDFTEWSKRQAYIALGYMILAARERDVDSTPVEGFKLIELVEKLQERDLIDADETVAVACFLGYTKGVKHPKLGPSIIRRIPWIEKIKTI